MSVLYLDHLFLLPSFAWLMAEPVTPPASGNLLPGWLIALQTDYFIA